MPSEVFVTIAGIAGLGVDDLMTTVYLPFADVLTPASRNDGLPRRLIRRLYENTTSAAVSGVPSENLMFLRRVNVYTFAWSETVYFVATSGSGWDTSAPLNCSSVS